MLTYRQKAQDILLPCSFLLLFLVLVPCIGSFCQAQHPSGEETNIDSLIRVIRINGKTHGHHDHTRGNEVFTEAKIIGHEHAIEEITRQNENREKAAANLKKIADEYHVQLQESEPGSADWEENFTQQIRCLTASNDLTNGTAIRKPDILVQDSLVVHLGSITFELFYFGLFHSKSDLLIYVPELQILFTGDLFTQYGRPSLNYPDSPEKEQWQESVQWLEPRMEYIRVIIGGHGQIMSVDDLRSFLSEMAKL